jgi:hypothetical protein
MTHKQNISLKGGEVEEDLKGRLHIQGLSLED